MRSRHASMSFITSVEARNTPKVQRNHSIANRNLNVNFSITHKNYAYVVYAYGIDYFKFVKILMWRMSTHSTFWFRAHPNQ